ncbi:MAG: hypothetical protein MHPSP_004409, partial [Paramarteilia canceri]
IKKKIPSGKSTSKTRNGNSLIDKERRRRNVMTCKRRKSLMSKAKQLHTLTGTEVLLVAVSAPGNVYHYASKGFQSVIDSEILKAACTQVEAANSNNVI